MIEILMFTTIVCLVVGTIARYRINESSKRIKELEEKLDRCYIEREQRLRDKGLITSPQDPAVCEYSGLPAVEHYSSREITIEDIRKITKLMDDLNVIDLQEEQKKHIVDIMEADEKDGLYNRMDIIGQNGNEGTHYDNQQ